MRNDTNEKSFKKLSGMTFRQSFYLMGGLFVLLSASKYANAQLNPVISSNTSNSLDLFPKECAHFIVTKGNFSECDSVILETNHTEDEKDVTKLENMNQCLETMVKQKEIKNKVVFYKDKYFDKDFLNPSQKFRHRMGKKYNSKKYPNIDIDLKRNYEYLPLYLKTFSYFIIEKMISYKMENTISDEFFQEILKLGFHEKYITEIIEKSGLNPDRYGPHLVEITLSGIQGYLIREYRMNESFHKVFDSLKRALVSYLRVIFEDPQIIPETAFEKLQELGNFFTSYERYLKLKNLITDIASTEKKQFSMILTTIPTLEINIPAGLKDASIFYHPNYLENRECPLPNFLNDVLENQVCAEPHFFKKVSMKRVCIIEPKKEELKLGQ